MNRLSKVFHAALILVILCVLLVPSIALAASENVTYAKINNNYLNQTSFSEPMALNSIASSEVLINKKSVQDSDTWSPFFKILAGIAVLTTSLVAGIVLAYANSVMPGLRKSDDRTFVLAIRHLTSSVANPVFLLISNGALIAQIGFVVVAISSKQFEHILLGSIALIFYVATLLITFLGNLPLNKAIISAELPISDSKWNDLRVRFESRWTLLNHLRTITCILSVAALLVALLIN